MKRRFGPFKVVLVLLAGALLLGLIPSSSVPSDSADAANGSAGEPASVDIPSLSGVPLPGWGVTGLDQPETTNIPSLVWDITQIGSRIYVGGAFLAVQENENATPVSQPYVAAFDVNTGIWDPGFRPVLDGPVLTLGVSPRGQLLVGGEFQSVSGQPNTAGIVSLNPVTGAIDTGFIASIERPWTPDLGVVRDLEVVGDMLYIGGNFSHIRGADAASRTRVYRVARLNANNGTPDSGWKPQVAGGSVWGLAVDQARGRVSLAGWFTSVNGAGGTGNFATVQTGSSNLVAGLIPLERNEPNAPELYDVEYASDRVWIGGSQHVVTIHDANNLNRIGFHTTGNGCGGFEGYFCGIISGGDFQVVERVGNYIVAGCHCLERSEAGQGVHWNSFTGQRSEHSYAIAYDAHTGALVESFIPDLGSSTDGVWAVHATTTGCLVIGGQFERGGYTTGSSYWVGNFARFCAAPLMAEELSHGNESGRDG